MDIKLNIESTNSNEIVKQNEKDEQTPNKISTQNDKFEVTPNNNKLNTDINIISPIPENFNTIDNDSNYNNNLLENIDFNDNINIDFNNNQNNIHKNKYKKFNKNRNNEQKKRISKSKNKRKNFFNKKKNSHTKYDYILKPDMKSIGPVEIPPNFDFKEENFVKINKNFAKFSKVRGISADRVENSKKKIRKSNIKIFNNKKNNDICSNLLKQSIENGKELSLFPYAKEKQKINKTIDTIGCSNGITYLKTSVLGRGNVNFRDHNTLNIMRDSNKTYKKYRNYRKNKEINNKKCCPSVAEINL